MSNHKKKTPQQAGREFEKQVAKKHDLKLHKGSGNLWYLKLDIGGKEIVFECKWSSSDSITISRAMIQKAQEATRGPGGEGVTPAIIAGSEGLRTPQVILDLNDLIMLLEEKRELFMQSKTHAKRERASVPSLFRKKERDDS